MKTFSLVTITLLIATLTSCKSNDDIFTCGGYGCDYDHISDLGIMYRDDTNDPLGRIVYLYTTGIDYNYKYVSECMGVWYKPYLLVIFTDALIDPHRGQLIRGFPNTILINPHYDYSDAEALRHEYVHYLLWVSTGDTDDNHISPLFKLCSDRQY